MPENKLANFISNYKEFSKTKKKPLLESIRKAKLIYDSNNKVSNFNFDLQEKATRTNNREHSNVSNFTGGNSKNGHEKDLSKLLIISIFNFIIYNNPCTNYNNIVALK